MVLQNKLGITESVKLAREEERISKSLVRLIPYLISMNFYLMIFMNLLVRLG